MKYYVSKKLIPIAKMSFFEFGHLDLQENKYIEF